MLVVPAAVTALLVAVLAGLGSWQLQRLAWKTGILAEIGRAEQTAPAPLTDDPPAFRKLIAHGTLRPDLASLYGADVRDTARGTVMGAQLIVPLMRDGAAPLLVDLGWLPAGARPDPGSGDITGYARPGDHAGWFSASDDVGGRHFFTLDPATIGAALGLHPLPFILVALGAPHGGIVPAEHLPQPPNDHLSYAITWFGLAAALLGVFAAWARKAVGG